MSSSNDSANRFLTGGGEMGGRIRAYRWGSTRLGPPDRWAQSLKTALRLLLSTHHPMFIWWGPDLIQFYNDAYRRSMGPERDPGALGQHGREGRGELWNTIGPQIEQVMNGRGHTWSENQLVPVSRHGKREDVYWTYGFSPIDEPDALNGIGGVLAIYSGTSVPDVSGSALASESLRAANRRKDEFLAMLAHELRNPLAPIRNASVLLSKLPTADQKTLAIGSLLERQVTQLARLVDDLLEVSRITQGRIHLQRSAMELGNAIDLAIETVQPLMREKCHELSIVNSEGPLHINGDLTRITQCIVNILTNAAKYTSAGGHIQISLRRSDMEGIIEVADNGSGISAEMLPKLFDPFVQAVQTLKHSHGGLGIGLSVVQKLVQMHGGCVNEKSSGLGQGSLFQIRLPLVSPPSQSAEVTVERALTSKRVLIVDDDVDAADSLAQILNFEGYVTEKAYSASEALDHWDVFSADIVLLDIGLPRMDGYEVARHMRASRKKSAIIALTGYAQAEDVQRAREAGFDAHLSKPVDFDELHRLLELVGEEGSTHEERSDRRID